ncbi:histidine kinase [Solibacillus sp. R5-41]|uniref:HAMP domain-containing sensor histidine kinase n=1 Tax=Solibacillus sp. R5-41 TaxID=2048654 RepID=UPI000C129270|nr:MFS domain-containing histidine kinase [Solibacillus sp. R5-41]ATP38828.1 histidine kinase [Solibacillus sp. R5-41]
MKKSKTHLQLFLMFIVATAVLMIFTQGSRYFGKTYYETNSFDSETYDFMEGLAKYVLNPITEEDKSEILTVTDEEINYYRTYYGSLAEQIQNIKDQYEMDADGSQDAEVKAEIEKERDAKIADIRKNFEDDEHVKAKILKQKKKALDGVLANYEQNKKDFLRNYNYFAYNITNEKTDEVFKKGDVKATSVYTFEINRTDHYMPTSTFYINLNEYADTGLESNSFELNKDNSHFYGEITIPKSILSKTEFGKSIEAFNLTKYSYYVLMILGFISFVLLMTGLEPTKKQFLSQSKAYNFFERLPLDMALVIVIFIGLISSMFLSGVLSSIHNFSYYGEDWYNANMVELIILTVMGYISFIITVYLFVWLWNRLANNTAIDQIWDSTFLSKLVHAGMGMFSNRTIGIQSLILLVVVYLGGFGLAVVFMAGSFEVLLFYVFLFVLFLIPALFIFMRYMGYLNRIMSHTKDMAEGRLTNDLKVKGKSPLAQHAEHLNGLREGVRSSVTEQAKSERLKTELITNVSHDLRTPLTSIITYTDLLKNSEITEEERAKYISILDAKSSRLKTLIEDLFEVSKMASGNIEITKQRIDLVQLLQQATGEHEEDFAASKIDLRVNISEQPIFAYVDGQKWWRVIDNLIINARKYSLEGTRVYVNLKTVNGEAELTVKNVAKYELNEDATELVERFKRADTSRNTEGSGLGLAIAQSIVDLHGGHLDVAIDGDLFKVTVSVRADK